MADRQTKKEEEESESGQLKSGWSSARWRLIGLNPVKNDVWMGNPLPNGHCARHFEIQMQRNTWNRDQRVNRRVAAMLDDAAFVFSIICRHSDLLHASAGANHDFDRFPAGKSHHGVQCVAQRKPSQSQDGNAKGDEALLAVGHFLLNIILESTQRHVKVGNPNATCEKVKSASVHTARAKGRAWQATVNGQTSSTVKGGRMKSAERFGRE